MQRGGLGDQVRAAASGQKIGLGLDGGGGRAGGQVQDGANGAERVGERHDRSAVHAIAPVRVLRTDHDAADDAVGLGREDLDADVLGEGRQSEVAQLLGRALLARFSHG